MVRRRPLLAWLLALLLSLQWGLLASHCLARLAAACHAPGGGHHRSELHHAGAHGAGEDHHLDAAAPDAEEDSSPALAALHDTCPVSPGPAVPTSPVPAVPASRLAYPVTLTAQISPVVLPPARAPPGQPRAPPLA